ncbi:hypothetical protein EJB05_06877 [Eragrostis curvula]|uniref:Uncharacterized protein n=1 Tax=Eragrostis curvula TaxID=38414 RepID=A0A5J9WEX5_9POAL|nr:hypothetical protein EJB05_06877 [Eragrostis curvula]
MAGNNVIWQPQEVAVLLLYYKEKIQVSGKSLVLREVHHEECSRRINEKYGTNFTGKQVYYKYHKLKAEWKHILEAKSASGASFDDEQKKIIYDETEAVKMKAKGDKRAKFYNVPIPNYDEMEFVFTGKHATGEFCVLQAPFDRPGRHDDDFIGNGKPNQEQGNGDVEPSQHYDSDTLPGSDSPISGGSKRKSEDKQKKGKQAKFDYAAVQEVTDVMKNMSETMRFTQTYLAQNGNIASMLKGRPEEAIKQWVAQWVMDRYPTGY